MQFKEKRFHLKWKSVLLVVTVLLYCACNGNPKSVEICLENAGSNRKEIETAIKYFKAQKDTLKIKALYYILANLSSSVTETYVLMDSAGKQISIGEWVNYDFEQAKEYLEKNNISFQLIATTEDTKQITGRYLISNIELAFDVWRNYPWCSTLTFDDFCNQILPHKFNGDSLDDWRKYYLSKNRCQLDSLKANQIPRDSLYFWLSRINQKQWKKTAALIPNSYLSYDVIEKIGGGTCDHLAKNAVQLMRACGLPLHQDLIPYHGKINGGHVYNSFISTQNKLIFFSPYERDPERTKWLAPLVLRENSNYTSSVRNVSVENDVLPNVGILTNHSFSDVTNQYFPTKNISLENKKTKEQIFLCTYNNGSFHAVKRAENVAKKIFFNNVTTGLLYFPMYFDGKELNPSGGPFILEDDGKITLVESKPNYQIDISGVKVFDVKKNITSDKKNYRLFGWNGKWEMIGESIRSGIKTLQFKKVKNCGLYLIYGDSTIERIQRPFTNIEDNIQYW